MTATVNGVATAPDAHGNVQGSFTEASKISGDGGNNTLQSNHGNDVMYGGAGNDTFKITAHALSNAGDTTNGYAANDVIYDFGGAGGYSATNNDFLSLVGFGSGSTISFSRYGGQAGVDGNPTDLTQQYYTVHDTTSGNDYTIYIHSLDGKQLAKGDYAFY